MKNLMWVANKVQEYLLNVSPYKNNFVSLDIIDKPTLIYDAFIILVEKENKIILGIQPTAISNDEVTVLLENLYMIVDNVIVRWLGEEKEAFSVQ